MNIILYPDPRLLRPALPLHQFEAKPFFKLAHLLADSSMRDVQLLGCPCVAVGFGHS